MADVVVKLKFILDSLEKTNASLHHGDKTLSSRRVSMFPFPSSGENPDSIELFFATVGGGSRILHQFDCETLNVATGSFSEANLTSGASCYCMYKGRLQNGQRIAIAQCDTFRKIEEFTKEVKLLVKLENEYLAELLGYCIQGRDVFLVYDFALYASLEDFIFDKDGMRTRLGLRKHCKKITLEVARVLGYLHKGAPFLIVHNEVNLGNIFLDENMKPKLLGFGCAKCLAINKACRSDVDLIHCTFGYIAPEYARDRLLPTKVDVFGFGVLVLQVISGCRMNDHMRSMKDFMQQVWSNWLAGTPSNILDPTIHDDPTSVRFLHTGLLCVQENADDRPTVEQAIGMLFGMAPLTLPIPQMPPYVVQEEFNALWDPGSSSLVPK